MCTCAYKHIHFIAHIFAYQGFAQANASQSSSRVICAFHAELWNSMIQRSFIPRHTIHHRDFEPPGVVELLRAINLLTIVMKVSPSVKTVVLEF